MAARYSGDPFTVPNVFKENVFPSSSHQRSRSSTHKSNKYTSTPRQPLGTHIDVEDEYVHVDQNISDHQFSIDDLPDVTHFSRSEISVPIAQGDLTRVLRDPLSKVRPVAPPAQPPSRHSKSPVSPISQEHPKTHYRAPSEARSAASTLGLGELQQVLLDLNENFRGLQQNAEHIKEQRKIHKDALSKLDEEWHKSALVAKNIRSGVKGINQYKSDALPVNNATQYSDIGNVRLGDIEGLIVNSRAIPFEKGILHGRPGKDGNTNVQEHSQSPLAKEEDPSRHEQDVLYCHKCQQILEDPTLDVTTLHNLKEEHRASRTHNRKSDRASKKHKKQSLSEVISTLKREYEELKLSYTDLAQQYNALKIKSRSRTELAGELKKHIDALEEKADQIKRLRQLRR